MNQLKSSLFLAVICSLSASVQIQASTLGFSLSDSVGARSGGLTVVVQDDSTLAPISDAQVTVSDSWATARGEKSRLSSHKGRARFSFGVTRSTAPKTVTVSKPGYAMASVVGVQSSLLTVFLKPDPKSAKDVIIHGTMNDWQTPFSDSEINVGIVFRSINVLDLIHFDARSLISPLQDDIDVMGARKINSNIVVPNQDITVFIASVNLNKPDYRLPVIPAEPVAIVGIQGKIAVSDVTPYMNGGIDLGIVNKFTFLQAGISQTITPQGDQGMTIRAQSTLSAMHHVTTDMPPFSGDVFAAALTDVTGDRTTLVPTDVKVSYNSTSSDGLQPVDLVSAKLNSGSQTESHDVLVVAEGAKAKQLSGILVQGAGATVASGPFLAATAPQTFTGLPNTFSTTAPQNGLSTTVFEARVSKGESTRPVWYVYTLPSAGTVQIPTRMLPGAAAMDSIVNLNLEFGSDFNEKQVDGQTVLRGLKRFARVLNSVK